MVIPFAPPVLTDRAAICKAVSDAKAVENDASFVNIYLLRQKYGIEIAFSGAMLLRRYQDGFRRDTYGFPLGEGDLRHALKRLCDDAAARALPLRLTMLTKAQCERLQNEFPDPLIIPIHCEGFKSKICASGFDAAFIAINKYILKSQKVEKEPGLINLFAPTTVSYADQKEMERMIQLLGAKVNYIPFYSSLEKIRKIPAAEAFYRKCLASKEK